MNYSKIYTSTITDGVGVRVSLYVSGCNLHCKGCHNEIAQSFTYGNPFTNETIKKIIKLLSKPYIEGLSICGGEPMEFENQIGIIELLREIKKELPEKDIWVWTGYELKDLLEGGTRHNENTQELLSYIDVIITGRFILSCRDISDNNRWRGSTNQKVIDLKTTLKTNKITYLKNVPNND